MATTEPGLDAVRTDVASHALFTSGEPLRAGKLVGEALPALQRQASALDARVARARAELHASIRSELHDLDRILAETSAAPEHTDSIPARIAAVDADLAQLAPLFSSRGAGEAAASSAHALQADALQGQLDALDDLYAARSYYLLLARADALAQAVLAADKGQGLSADGQDGKEEALRHLIALGDLVSAAMDAWARGAGTSDEPQVLAYLRAQLVRTYDTLKHDRSAALATALSDAGWPVSMFSEENVTGQTTEPAEVRARERAILHDTHVREAWFDLCSLQRLGDGSLWPDPREREAQLLFLPPASSMSPSPDTAPPGAHEFIPLLPSWLLLQPTLQRFAYHFDTDHASNRLDKPEWWMRHLLDVLAHQLPLWHASAPALDEGSVRHLNSLGGYEGADTVQELVHVILCTARVKIEASMPALVEHPHLLAHTLFAAMDFDAELADMVAAAPTVPEHTRPAPIRLAHLILDKDEWFEAWLEGEKKHAFSTLESILSIRHAWRISLADGTADDEYNPAVTGPVLTPSGARAPLASTTICSRETVELLDHITALYRPLLPSTGDKTLLHRLAFWDQIQRPLVSTFLAALKAALDTFESASSVFARHMPGGMLGGEPLLSRPSAEEEDQSDTKASLPTRGPAGVQRLCAIYISAYYLRTSLVSWSSQGLFLELSHDLLARGILPDTFAPQSGLKGLLQRGVQSSKQVAGAFRPLSGRPTDGLDTGMGREEADVSLWSGLVEDTSALEQRAAQAIRKLVVGEVSEALVEYSRRNWIEGRGQPQPCEPDPDTVPTVSLLPALTALAGHLDQLGKSLCAPGVFLPIYRSIAQDISDTLVDKVLLQSGGRRFDYTGAQRLRQDLVQGWWGVVHEAATRARDQGSRIWGRNPEIAWRSIRQASQLLALPPDQEGVSIVPGRRGVGAQAAAGHPDPSSSRAPAEWTIADAIYAAFDEDEHDDQLGFPALVRAVGGFDAGHRLACEVLRRRIECPR